MDIRVAQKGDLPVINEIYNQAVRQRFCTAHLTPVSLKQHETWFTTHDPDRFPVFVAEDEDQVVGWVSLGAYREDREALAHVAEVSYYVDQQARGKGIGSVLLKYAISAAPDYGFSVLLAILLNRNPASIALLKKFEFTQWGSMPGIASIDDQLADHLYYGLKL